MLHGQKALLLERYENKSCWYNVSISQLTVSKGPGFRQLKANEEVIARNEIGTDWRDVYVSLDAESSFLSMYFETLY